MADIFSKSKRSEVMRKIRSKNTKPEVTLRKVLHKQGLRFRLHAKTLPGKPDIVLPMYRTVIQVRGCFWHGHHCIDGHMPNSRREYWGPKLLNNKRRDIKNDAALRKTGWSVVVVWDCKIQNSKALNKEVNRILTILEAKISTGALANTAHK